MKQNNSQPSPTPRVEDQFKSNFKLTKAHSTTHKHTEHKRPNPKSNLKPILDYPRLAHTITKPYVPTKETRVTTEHARVPNRRITSDRTHFSDSICGAKLSADYEPGGRGIKSMFAPVFVSHWYHQMIAPPPSFPSGIPTSNPNPMTMDSFIHDLCNNR